MVRTKVTLSVGVPHVGEVYVALANSVFARKNAGQLVLLARGLIDSDLLDALRGVGVRWEEGPFPCPWVGNRCGWRRDLQTERNTLYRRYAQQLVTSGAAYPCFATASELQEMHERQIAAGQVPHYDRRYRDLSREEAMVRVAAGESHVIRLAMPTDGQTKFVDLLHGEISIDNSVVEDQILLTELGQPTAALTDVVDSGLACVSHSIQTEEQMPSLPGCIHLYHALGFEPPQFLHLPLLRNADRSKISRRKNSVDPKDYFRGQDWLGWIEQILEGRPTDCPWIY